MGIWNVFVGERARIWSLWALIFAHYGECRSGAHCRLCHMPVPGASVGPLRASQLASFLRPLPSPTHSPQAAGVNFMVKKKKNHVI